MPWHPDPAWVYGSGPIDQGEALFVIWNTYFIVWQVTQVLQNTWCCGSSNTPPLVWLFSRVEVLMMSVMYHFLFGKWVVSNGLVASLLLMFYLQSSVVQGEEEQDFP